MRKVTVFTTLVLLGVLCLTASSYPTSLDDGVIQCYQKECPSRTTGCKKVVKTTADKKSLETTITCLDIQDMLLKEYNEYTDNPFGPHTDYESTSFSGTYIFSNSGSNNNYPVDININNEIGGGIEDFA